MNTELRKIFNNLERISEENAGRLTSIDKEILIINGEMGKTQTAQEDLCKDVVELKVNLGTIRTDVNWLKKTYWAIFSASIGALIVGLISMLFK